MGLVTRQASRNHKSVNILDNFLCSMVANHRTLNKKNIIQYDSICNQYGSVCLLWHVNCIYTSYVIFTYIQNKNLVEIFEIYDTQTSNQCLLDINARHMNMYSTLIDY